VFLPGGEHALFFNAAKDSIRGELDAIDLATRQVRKVVDAESGARYVAPGYLLYIQNGTLVAQRFEASALTTMGSRVRVAENVDFLASMWTGPYNRAALSPDDTRVVTVESDRRAIWLYDLNRGVGRRLTFDTGAHDRPVWSPDGAAVVYANEDLASGGWTLSLQAADGTAGPRILYRSKTFIYPSSWSPDGKFIALTVMGNAATGRREIRVLPMGGTDRKPFRFGQENNPSRDGQFSPDGRWFLYTADEPGGTQFYAVPFPRSGGKWQIPTDSGNGFAVWITNSQIGSMTN